MRVCGDMALDQIALFQTVKGLESQSHSCFHGRMAVTAVILPFFVPAAFNEEEHEYGRTEKYSKAQGKTRCSRTGG
jgi:hypothetical protein